MGNFLYYFYWNGNVVILRKCLPLAAPKVDTKNTNSGAASKENFALFLKTNSLFHHHVIQEW